MTVSASPRVSAGPARSGRVTTGRGASCSGGSRAGRRGGRVARAPAAVAAARTGSFGFVAAASAGDAGEVQRGPLGAAVRALDDAHVRGGVEGRRRPRVDGDGRDVEVRLELGPGLSGVGGLVDRGRRPGVHRSRGRGVQRERQHVPAAQAAVGGRPARAGVRAAKEAVVRADEQRAGACGRTSGSRRCRGTCFRSGATTSCRRRWSSRRPRCSCPRRGARA